MNEQSTQQKSQTFRGTIENAHSKDTRTGLAMVVFKVNGYAFKAFGDQAAAVQQLEGQHAEITAKHNTFMGKDEYAVITIAGEANGHPVTASHTSSAVPASSTQQQRLKHDGRHQWNLKSGSDAKARQVGLWLNQFFDDLSEAEWEQWKKYPSSHWPIHDADRDADQIYKETFVREYKEDFERRYGKPYPGTDVDIICSSPGRKMPQDSESVRARFYTRLDEVRSDLKRTSSPTDPATPAETSCTEPPTSTNIKGSPITSDMHAA